MLSGAHTVGRHTTQFLARTYKEYSWRPIMRRSFVTHSLLLPAPMNWPADCKE